MNLQRVKYKDIEQLPPFPITHNFKQDFQGSAPAPFIGRFGYPKVNIGVLSPQFSGDMSSYDSPKLWNQQHFAVNQIASLRYGLVNSRIQANIKEKSRYVEMVQEVGMAAHAPEVEISLTKQPTLALNKERDIIPFGPASEIKKARITANVKIHSHVEKVVGDRDLKAAEGILELYKKGFEENILSKLISVGTLGIERKLVPTRWSITAVDDTLGKELITQIKDLPSGDYTAFFGGGWGNYYLILFFPEAWEYELFETYIDKERNPWSKQGYKYSTDYENHNGRKNYAGETAGGYYACRLPILEKMKELKRQHSCLALRFITAEYTTPLGVWVCREATRKSLQAAIDFSDRELLLSYAHQIIKKKFGFDLNLLLNKSQILRQKKLTDF